MIAKTITYTDLNGDVQTETFHFHLSKVGLAELQLTAKGGMETYIQNIVDAEDGQAIIDMFKKILRLSYGKKSEDGKRFVRTTEMWQEFEQSEAYSELFLELVTDAGAAAKFVKGMIPSDLQGLADKAFSVEAKPPVSVEEDPNDPKTVEELRAALGLNPIDPKD